MKKHPIVIVADDTKSISCNSQFQQEPFIISNPYKDLDIIYNKQWVCKGKHQYRKIKTEFGDTYWTCQCGKSLTSKI